MNDPLLLFGAGVVGVAINWLILYYIIRAAVHHGTRDAQKTASGSAPRVAGPREERSLNTR